MGLLLTLATTDNTAELWATREQIKAGKINRHIEIHIETDSLLATRDTLLLVEEMDGAWISLGYREGNKVTDVLAKFRRKNV